MIVPRIIHAPVRISRPAHQDDGAALHLQAGEVAHRPADDDDARASSACRLRCPAEPSTRIVPPFMPGQAAAVGRADLAAGVAADVDQAARHLAADPVGGVARAPRCVPPFM